MTAEFLVKKAVVLGASGGLGQALVMEIGERYPNADMFALMRKPGNTDLPDRAAQIRCDYTEPHTLADAADCVGSEVDLVIVATGLRHSANMKPEKSLAHLEPNQLMASYLTNAVGPSVAMRYFLPNMAKGRKSVLAALSARVGSISDNRLGGWYAYRASKAALNQLIRTASIEQARKFPHCVVVGLHPGTVDTALSQPFQRNVPKD